MSASPALPDWPLLMDEAMAARFTSFTRRDFRALVAAQVMPPPRQFPPLDQLRWHRLEIEAVVGRFFGLPAFAAEAQHEADRRTAYAALEGYNPLADQRKSSGNLSRR